MCFATTMAMSSTSCAERHCLDLVRVTAGFEKSGTMVAFDKSLRQSLACQSSVFSAGNFLRRNKSTGDLEDLKFLA